MIREFTKEDETKLRILLQRNSPFEESTIEEYLKSEKETLLVYDEGEIIGLASLKAVNIEEKEYRILVYVDPLWRRKGIGTALYNSISNTLHEIKPNLLTTYFVLEKQDQSKFYKSLGYKKWWGYHEAKYTERVRQPEVNLTLIPYEDKYYDIYTKAISQCFYELRKGHDLKPYYVTFNEKDREELNNLKDSIYLLLVEEELIASALVKDGYLDNIFVLPDHQGKGLGKKITQFAINKALDEKAESISLSVLCWNKKAIKLYESLGFEITKTLHYYRQLCDIEF